MSEEIYVVSTVEAKAEHVDEVRKAYGRPLSDELRAAGCLAYDCYQHLGRPTTFAAVGHWVSNEAFQNHLKANEAALAATNQLLAKEPDLLYLCNAF